MAAKWLTELRVESELLRRILRLMTNEEIVQLQVRAEKDNGPLRAEIIERLENELVVRDIL